MTQDRGHMTQGRVHTTQDREHAQPCLPPACFDSHKSQIHPEGKGHILVP